MGQNLVWAPVLCGPFMYLSCWGKRPKRWFASVLRQEKMVASTGKNRGMCICTQAKAAKHQHNNRNAISSSQKNQQQQGMLQQEKKGDKNFDLDQVRWNIESRFDSSGIVTAENGEHMRCTFVAEANLGSLPDNTDALCLQLRMLRDLTTPGKFQTDREIGELLVIPASTTKEKPSCFWFGLCLLHQQRDLSRSFVSLKLRSVSLSLNGD